MLAYRYDEVRYDHPLTDIPLDRLGLHVYAADELHLRHHTGGFLLPVEDIHQLIIHGVHRPVDERIGLFAACVQVLFGGLLPLWSQHHGAGAIILEAKQTVKGLWHIVLAGIVHEVEHHQAILTLIKPHSAPKLLGIKYLGHGRSRHEQHLGLGTVPAFVEQVTGAQNLDLAALKLGNKFFPLEGFHDARYGCGNDIFPAEHIGNLLGVLDRRAEHDGTLVPHILEPCVHDEAVALRHIDLALQIADVILNAIEAHFCQINIGVDTNAAHGNQLADLHGGLDVQLVRCVFEYIKDILVVGTFRRRGQAEGKAGLEIFSEPPSDVL